MKRFALLVLLIPFLFLKAQDTLAQKSYSDDEDIFFNQALQGLNRMGTEPARKVAFDLRNAWMGKFNSKHKQKIHQIALKMQRKGYDFQPYFWYYYSYLAFSVAQADLNANELTELLDINEQVLETMNREEYENFLLGLSMFMARRIVTWTNNIKNITDGGTFNFKLLDEYVEVDDYSSNEVIDEPVVEEETFEEDTSADPWANDDTTNDPWAAQDDPWNSNQNDPWDDNQSDPWADNNDDPWGQSADPWDNQNQNQDYNDNWVESDDSWGYDDVGQVFEEKNQGRQFVEAIEQDYIAGIKAKYIHPELTGPAIQLENNGMLIVTPYDSMRIKETDGTLLLKERIYAGDNAVINWPADNKNAKGAVVNLGQFFIRTDRSDFWSPNASMTFPDRISGKVDGVFEFKSQRRKVNTLSDYPIFTSMEANINVDLKDPNLKYRGGIQIKGNKYFGTSISRKDGVLTILDGNGNQAIFRSPWFEFREDSTIYAKQASLTIKHQGDSLFHPAVEMWYKSQERELIALRTEEYQVTPFVSTYFEVDINAEILKWNMNQDSIRFSIVMGKDLVPVTIESKDFFNDARFGRLSGGMVFHPVVTSVYYARMYNTRQFADLELSEHFKTPIKQIRAGMKVLKEYGFGTYDRETGLVTLNDKAFRYADASGNKIDYDNIMIPSVAPDVDNAIWRLDSGDMIVNGVERFFFTSDFKVYAEPDSSQITLLKNRNIKMNGMVNAGDFQYRGKDYLFDYDAFLVQLTQVDSIRIQLNQDTTQTATGEQTALNNHLNETSGTLYLDDPSNKSGLKKSLAYPDFISESSSVVYFDGPEVLNGAYDKSVKFVIPPHEDDSLSIDEALSFSGTFNSGGIFPDFQETLKLQPDKSLGFIHKIPDEGYNLYGTSAKTYENIRLSNSGMRGTGKIDFITSTIYSDDFVYYPDSVAAYGTGGVIRPGDANGSSYPEAVLGPYRMHWEPRIDSMYLKNIRKPFKFYNATAELDGAVDITTRGVYGSGTMFTRGSKAKSQELEFKEYSYGARHAAFEVLTDNPQKPALQGKDIRLNFDLVKNSAVISPEKAGVAALEFPYAQMRTSITKAVWDLEDSTVTMTKPANVPIENSYFYTTREELDSLAFNAEEATYDFNSKELFVKGIPYITVADAEIIPENNETTILENFELQEFKNARIKIDTLHEYHYLTQGEIKILSRNRFIGSAVYELVTGVDTFDIRFDHFDLLDVPLKDGGVRKMTVSDGEVLAKDNLIINPGFFYKGKVRMYADQPQLILDGSVKLILRDPSYDYWVQFKRERGETGVAFQFENAFLSDESQAIAGIHFDLRGGIYPTFVEKRENESDEDLFMAKGLFQYDEENKVYKIENPDKTDGVSFEGHTMIYNDSTQDIVIEGQAQFFSKFNETVTIDAAVMGNGNMETNEFDLDAFLAINLANSDDFMELMADDLIDIIERLGPPLANENELELLYKLANMTSDKVAKDYEKASLKDYKPMVDMDESLEKSIVVSGVKLKWSNTERAFYNTTKLAISNIGDEDINAKLDGFIEMKKDQSNNDVLNLFIQAAPGTWYYISYASNNLYLYSSNSKFNDEVTAKSNFGSAKPGELTIVLGEENETLKFINEFRENYFGITEPYDLVSPDDVILEDENFDTIEEDEDDGFGF